MKAISRTNRGLVRENNEDSVLVQVPHLFAIADGMGGEKAGEVASFEAVKLLSGLDLSKVKDDDVLCKLEEKIKNINSCIWNMWHKDGTLKGMGTTLTAVYMNDLDRAFVGHVGDSRIYLMQDEILKQVTSDHSYVAELVRQKKITQKEADSSTNKHFIMRAVGAEEDVVIDLFEFLIAGAQKLLLCSDGLSNMVPHDEMQKILTKKDLNEIADDLMNLALKAGGKDNISFIVLDLEG